MLWTITSYRRMEADSRCLITSFPKYEYVFIPNQILKVTPCCKITKVWDLEDLLCFVKKSFMLTKAVFI